MWLKKGKIFSIEEFSVFDGPGIRMTVFLKGCPMRCAWCHNPEGQSFETQIVRSPNGCIGCGACLNEGLKQNGISCLVENSVSVCPNNLVRICGLDVKTEDIVGIISKKADLLNRSGGGVTFSGGEPLAQHKFLKSCLTELRGVTHRAIQTTGFCDKSVFVDVLSECDYVLYDLKHMSGDIHKKYIGVDNRQILENYKILAGSGKDFITRIPLIPSVNDTEENITKTCEFLVSNGVDKIELLPYNRSAGAKYKLIGIEYKIDFDENADVNIRKEIFDKYDIKVRVL